MRKISLLGLFALLFTLSVQQQASAWLNFKFGAGVNWNWQSGGNNWFWNLFRNGQPPGYGNTCDPACMPCASAFNMACQPQGCMQQPGMGQGCMQQQPFMGQGCMQQPMGQGYMPYMQQPCMPQQGPWGQCQPPCGGTCNPPLYPSFGNGHSLPHEFQFFGSLQGTQPSYLGDSSRTVAAYNGYQGQSYYPSSSASYYGNNSSFYGTGSSYYPGGYYGNGSNYYYPNSYYGNGYYGNTGYGNGSNYYGNGSACSSASYYGPYGAASSYYYPNNSYQSNPYNYSYNTCCNYGY